MLVELNGITKGVTSGAGTANPSGAHEFTERVHVVQSVVFCVVFVDHSLSFLFWPLCFLSFH